MRDWDLRDHLAECVTKPTQDEAKLWSLIYGATASELPEFSARWRALSRFKPDCN